MKQQPHDNYWQTVGSKLCDVEKDQLHGLVIIGDSNLVVIGNNNLVVTRDSNL